MIYINYYQAVLFLKPNTQNLGIKKKYQAHLKKKSVNYTVQLNVFFVSDSLCREIIEGAIELSG